MTELKELPAGLPKAVDVAQFRRLVHERNEILKALLDITYEAGGTFHNNPNLAKAVLNAREIIEKFNG